MPVEYLSGGVGAWSTSLLRTPNGVSGGRRMVCQDEQWMGVRSMDLIRGGKKEHRGQYRQITHQGHLNTACIVSDTPEPSL